jgi:hypothetical protein
VQVIGFKHNKNNNDFIFEPPPPLSTTTTTTPGLRPDALRMLKRLAVREVSDVERVISFEGATFDG